MRFLASALPLLALAATNAKLKGKTTALSVTETGAVLDFEGTAQNKNKITISLESLTEFAMNVEEAIPGHAIKSFAKTKFAASRVAPSMPIAGNAECASPCKPVGEGMSLSTAVEALNNAKVHLRAYILPGEPTQALSTSFGDEKFSLRGSMLGLELSVENWPFCETAPADGKASTCEDDGMWLQAQFRIRTPAAPKSATGEKIPAQIPSETEPASIDGGAGAKLYLSSRFISDGKSSMMPNAAGGAYPRVVPHGDEKGGDRDYIVLLGRGDLKNPPKENPKRISWNVFFELEDAKHAGGGTDGDDSGDDAEAKDQKIFLRMFGVLAAAILIAGALYYAKTKRDEQLGARGRGQDLLAEAELQQY